VRRGLYAFALVAACGRKDFAYIETSSSADACAVELAPAQPRINASSQLAFAASGGVEPYAYAVTGNGAIDSVTGMFSSGALAGTAVVRVADSAGCSAEVALEIGGDRLFYVGGMINTTATGDVYSSLDGTTWTLVAQLPAARYYSGAYVFRDRIWIVGGEGSSATAVNTIYSSTDGVAWTEVGTIPTATYLFGHTVFDGRMWIAGGYNDANNVYASNDGTTWTRIGGLPADNHGGSLAVLADKLYYMGGHNGTLYDWVLASSDGATWNQTATLSPGREYHASISLANELVIVGGQDTTPASFSLVTTSSNGTAFSDQPALPVARAFTTVQWFAGTLWSVGGNDGGGVLRQAADGTWSPVTSNFPVPRRGGGLVAFTPAGS